MNKFAVFWSEKGKIISRKFGLFHEKNISWKCSHFFFAFRVRSRKMRRFSQNFNLQSVSRTNSKFIKQWKICAKIHKKKTKYSFNTYGFYEMRNLCENILREHFFREISIFSLHSLSRKSAWFCEKVNFSWNLLFAANPIL